jgi:hypothetical protein
MSLALYSRHPQPACARTSFRGSGLCTYSPAQHPRSTLLGTTLVRVQADFFCRGLFLRRISRLKSVRRPCELSLLFGRSIDIRFPFWGEGAFLRSNLLRLHSFRGANSSALSWRSVVYGMHRGRLHCPLPSPALCSCTIPNAMRTVPTKPLPASTILLFTPAVAGQHLAKHKAIVTRITAIEELVEVTILCSDKTIHSPGARLRLIGGRFDLY